MPGPAQRVWELLVDWPRQSEWMPATRVRVLDGTAGPETDPEPDPEPAAEAAGENGLGTRVEARTGFGPLVVVDPMEVVEWDPPHRCVVRHDGRIVRGLGVFEIDPLDDASSLLTWREEFDQLPRLSRYAAGAFAPLATPFFALALRRLDRLLDPFVA